MTISQLFYPVLSKSLPLLIISVVLTACSTEENFTDSTTGAGTGVVQGVNPEPVSEPSLETSEPSLETAPVATLQNINLSWVAPVEREDGTPITMAEIAGYRIYYGTSKGNYTNNVDIADSSTMQATLSNLITGTYYIVMTTYDMDRRESVFSQVVTKSI